MIGSNFRSILGSLTLISFALIELQLYNFFSSERDLNTFDIAFGATCIVLVFSSFLFNRGNFNLRISGFLSYMSRVLQSSGSFHLLDISFIIFTIFHLAWIPDACIDAAKGDSSPYLILIFLGGYIFAFFTKPYIPIDKTGDKKKNKREILLTGISGIRYNNLEPIINVWNEYRNINKVVILLSDNTVNVNLMNGWTAKAEDFDCCYTKPFLKYKNSLSEILGSEEIVLDNFNVDKVKPIITSLIIDCIEAKYPHIKGDNIQIEFTNPVDYNNYRQCEEEVQRIMRHVDKRDTSKTVVNITSGTSTVASVMTICAIIGDRGLIFHTQDPVHKTKIVKEYNPDITTVPELLEDFIQKHQN